MVSMFHLGLMSSCHPGSNWRLQQRDALKSGNREIIQCVGFNDTENRHGKCCEYN